MALAWANKPQSVPPSSVAKGCDIGKGLSVPVKVIQDSVSQTFFLTATGLFLQGSSAFVYCLISFTDKLSNIAVIQIIQIMHPCKTEYALNI